MWYVYVYVFVGEGHGCTSMCLWEPEVNAFCSPQSLPLLLFEAVSLVELGLNDLARLACGCVGLICESNPCSPKGRQEAAA